MPKPIERKSQETEDKAVELAYCGGKMKDIAAIMGLISKSAFDCYQRKFEDFRQRITDARNAYCADLEDELLVIHNEIKDPKKAEIYSKNIMQVLKYRNPQRYGDKVNIDMSMTVDIAGSLERAQARIDQTMREVVPIATNVVPILQGKKNDGE